jgi:hypothetical protein
LHESDRLPAVRGFYFWASGKVGHPSCLQI